MKKFFYIILGIGIAVLIGGWLLLPDGLRQSDVKESIGENNIASEPAEKEKSVTLTINDGEKEIKIFEVEFIEGKTAFDLLKDKTEELNITLKTKTYDIGVMIEAIGDIKNGQDGKYWLYYVNGEAPNVSADRKELSPGDKVEFKFEKSLF